MCIHTYTHRYKQNAIYIYIHISACVCMCACDCGAFCSGVMRCIVLCSRVRRRDDATERLTNAKARRYDTMPYCTVLLYCGLTCCDVACCAAMRCIAPIADECETIKDIWRRTCNGILPKFTKRNTTR